MKSSDVFRDMSAKEQVAALVQTAIEAAVQANRAQVDLEMARLRTGSGSRPAQGSSGNRQTLGQRARDAHSLVDAYRPPEEADEEHRAINEAVAEGLADEDDRDDAGETPPRIPRPRRIEIVLDLPEDFTQEDIASAIASAPAIRRQMAAGAPAAVLARNSNLEEF